MVDTYITRAAESHVQGAVAALNDDDRTTMAMLALAGWSFRMKHFADGPHKWVGEHAKLFGGARYAPTLLSLIGYIERDGVEG